MSYNYLRRYRRRGTLSQREMAYLLGIEHRLRVLRYEREQASPSLTTLLAYQVIHDVAPHELFPLLYQQVGQEVSERALILIEQLKDSDHRDARFKLDALGDIRRRW